MSPNITARSLVGMSQTARKRAARKAQAAVRILLKDQPADAAKLKLLRGLYRIGERLRPCPGCIRCNCSTGFAVWPELGEALCTGKECDGSGVLPARKEKS